MKHIDEWIEEPIIRKDKNLAYAKFVFNYFRLPAWMRSEFETWMKEHKLFCTYEGKRYRVTGASRMGDIWLAKDKDREHGYDHRVCVTSCSEWSNSMKYDG